MTFVVAWLVLLAVILTVEFAAIFNIHRGDTLSEQVWWLRGRWWGRVLLYPLWAWLTYHFFLEPSSVALHTWWDDYALVAIVLIGTLAAAFIKEPKKEEELRLTHRLDIRSRE